MFCDNASDICTKSNRIGFRNFGPKPTFDDLEQSLEAHILDYDGNIYDEALSIEFLCKIRDQIKFKSIEELKNQINKDKIRAKELKKLYE